MELLLLVSNAIMRTPCRHRSVREKIESWSTDARIPMTYQYTTKDTHTTRNKIARKMNFNAIEIVWNAACYHCSVGWWACRRRGMGN